MNGHTEGRSELTDDNMMFTSSAPNTAPHNFPLPPTATQITMSIDVATFMLYGLIIPTCAGYSAPPTPASIAPIANANTLNAYGLYPAKYSRDSRSRTAINTLPRRDFTSTLQAR